MLAPCGKRGGPSGEMASKEPNPAEDMIPIVGADLRRAEQSLVTEEKMCYEKTYIRARDTHEC